MTLAGTLRNSANEGAGSLMGKTMTKSNKLFFHVDHVGSFLRPPELHQARAEALQGRIGKSALRMVEDKCIRQVIAMQERIGLPVVTDGEFRRDWWHIDFLNGFDGIELSDSGDVYGEAKFKDTAEQPPPQAQHARSFSVSEVCCEKHPQIHDALSGNAARAR